MLQWQPEFQSNQPKKPLVAFPYPDDALDEILSKVLTSETYYFKSTSAQVS